MYDAEGREAVFERNYKIIDIHHGHHVYKGKTCRQLKCAFVSWTQSEGVFRAPLASHTTSVNALNLSRAVSLEARHEETDTSRSRNEKRAPAGTRFHRSEGPEIYLTNPLALTQ